MTGNASGLLEPCAEKFARTVLRGRGGGDAALLPDQKYERGDNRMVASVLFRIADFFGVDVGDLFALANASRERAPSARLVVLSAPRDAMQRHAPEHELIGVMSNYSKISDENVREGVNQLIERLAAEPYSGYGRLDGERCYWESP